jgi:hypothetical protein
MFHIRQNTYLAVKNTLAYYAKRTNPILKLDPDTFQKWSELDEKYFVTKAL